MVAAGPAAAPPVALGWFDPGDTWLASEPADDCAGSVDAAGRSWTDPAFDDAAWTAVRLPDVASIPEFQDRYYRLHVPLTTASAAQIELSVDDGLTLYANGHHLGTWGADECHGEGVAAGTVVDLTAYLHLGDNVLAIHASNGPGESLVHAVLSLHSLAPAKIVPFLDLPYDYGSASFAVESSSLAQGGRVSAYFDHQTPGSCGGRSCAPSDLRAVHFYGYEGTASVPGEPVYQVWYNGHSGTDFALNAGRPVLAAAEGVVTFAGEISSVCSDGRTRAARVVRVLHPNGYSTEYWHLSAFAEGIQIGTAVTRDRARPIGYVGATGCTTGPHLHFAVYTASRAVVDPYAWSPRPETLWYGRGDPWRGGGRYLWLWPLVASANTAPGEPAVVYAPSGYARVVVPPEAAPGTLRVDVAEALPAVRIPNHLVLYLFSAAAYDEAAADGDAVPQLAAPAFVEARMAGRKLQAIDAGSTDPVVVRWDPATGTWLHLTTVWDRGGRIASAPTERLGTFALTLPTYAVYLPFVSRTTGVPPDYYLEPTPEPTAQPMPGSRR
jgi:murein DD-endopeptidase MepM/ murein hydrolase activator NlpD